MRIRYGALVALAVGVLVAGCGGGGGGGRLTKEGYIAAADAICKEASDKIDALGDPQTAEEVAQLADQVVEISEDQLAQLRALQPPEADEATINEAYDLIEQQIDIARQVGDAARANDPAKIQELVQEGQQINERADQIAVDYGLKECGSN
jgi:hypothetical protein